MDVTAPIHVEQTPIPVHAPSWDDLQRCAERISTMRAVASAFVAVIIGLALAAWYARGQLDGVAKRDEVRAVTARVVEVEKAVAVNESQHLLILESLRRIESKVDRIGPTQPIK